jgi:mannosyltransferase OCH1-like enzyme
LLNEFTLDGSNVDRLRELKTLQAAERLPKTQEVVRQAPDSTAAALHLLVAMRLLGRFSRTGTGMSGEREIPKRIIQYWDATRPPDAVFQMMQSWRDMHPGWDYRLFDDARAYEFIKSNYPADVLHAYVHAAHAAQKADLFRLAYLGIEGGFYADADDRALACVSTVIPPDVTFAGYQEKFGSVGNNFLGAAPGHPFIARALQQAVESINRGDRDVIWLSTGPGMMSRVFAQCLADPAGAEQLLRSSLLLEPRQLNRAVAVHCRLNYKKTKLHWRHGAFARGSGAPGKTASMPPSHRVWQ